MKEWIEALLDAYQENDFDLSYEMALFFMRNKYGYTYIPPIDINEEELKKHI